MENTTKEQIISSCQKAANSEDGGFIKLFVKESSYTHYEVKSNTILQHDYKYIPIYSTAHIMSPNKITVLGYCDNLSFLDPQTAEEALSTHDDSQAKIADIIEMSGDCFGFFCANI
jgi:hypothetical protein